MATPPPLPGRRLPLAFAAIFVVIVGGCPSRFDLRAEPLDVKTQNPEAQRAFDAARGELDGGRPLAARRIYAELRHRFPDDPLIPGATLWEARAALAVADPAAAEALLAPLAARPESDPVGERARFLLGLALARRPEPEASLRARTLLAPFVPKLTSGPDVGELHAALAACAERLGEVAVALEEHGRFLSVATPIARRYVRDHLARLVEALPRDRLGAIHAASPREGLAAALLGPRLAAELRQQGDEAAARTLLEESRAARRRLGLSEGSEAAITEFTVGVALPMSGRNRLLGERALRGVLLAGESIPPAPSSLDLRLRDTASLPERAGAVIDELAALGVVAIIGSPDRGEAQAQALRAEALGVPLLSLAPDDGGGRAMVLRLLRPNPSRAEALAAHALAAGARRLAILHSDSAYGKRMAERFAATVKGRGELVATVQFSDKATTFIREAKQLAAARPDALFVPGPATQLELIAAQLVATGLTRLGSAAPAPPPTAAKRGLLLLATADGVSRKLLTQSGRYVQGAVLAPSYFADGTPGSRPVVDQFRAAFGDEPGTADALAWDAARALRLALGRTDAGQGRANLLAALTLGREPGLTGPLGFTAAGERAGAPTLFLVEGEVIRALK